MDHPDPVRSAVGQPQTAPCRLVRAPIDGASLLEAVSSGDAGGNVLFLGTTRGVTDGVVTRGLEYEAHEPLALRMLVDLRAEAIDRFKLSGCAVVHRLGAVPVGAASIAIAAAAPHRREAFVAAEWLLGRIKQVVPIWKCDEGADGTRTWIHPGDMRSAVGVER
jgi:molybdopterin synthase catalytic subunit